MQICVIAVYMAFTGPFQKIFWLPWEPADRYVWNLTEIPEHLWDRQGISRIFEESHIILSTISAFLWISIEQLKSPRPEFVFYDQWFIKFSSAAGTFSPTSLVLMGVKDFWGKDPWNPYVLLVLIVLHKSACRSIMILFSCNLNRRLDLVSFRSQLVLFA